MLPKLQTLHCNGILILNTITVIVPLQKFRQKLRKGAITNDHSNGSTSPSRLSTNVTITEKPKNPKFSQQKLRYSPETELINNFDKKSQFRFDCKKKYNILWASQTWTMNPKFIDVMVIRKTSFRSCFKLETRSTILLYDHIMHAFDHLSIYATKTRTKIAYDCKAKRKLKQTKLKFSNEQNH